MSFDRSNLILDQSSQADLHSKSCRTLDSNFTHKHTLTKSKTRQTFWSWFANITKWSFNTLVPNSLKPNKYVWMFLCVLHMFLIVLHMFMHNTSFDFKSTSKIWKKCLFHSSFKSLNLGCHHPHTFIRVYFSIQMSCLINWIRVYHVHTH